MCVLVQKVYEPSCSDPPYLLDQNMNQKLDFWVRTYLLNQNAEPSCSDPPYLWTRTWTKSYTSGSEHLLNQNAEPSCSDPYGNCEHSVWELAISFLASLEVLL